MSSDFTTASVFLNGKGQIIEMLKFMTPKEREVLLKNIRARNSQLADELLEQSLTFSSLNELPDDDLILIFNSLSAPIVGVALKGSNREFQRRILSLAPRDYAEKAYSVLMTNLSNEARDVQRAQNKVLNALGSHLKRKRML
jgi:flagellar motor switch protein FliG